MIYNIRGTHGSGKSSLVQYLFKKYPHELLDVSPRGRPEGYRVHTGLRKPLYVVGPYATACGGCDAVQPYDLIWPRVERYAKLGHVLFEGALISVSVGSIGLAMAKRKKECVILYLDTPVEVCLARIAARREKKGGNPPPLNPKNTQLKHLATERTRPKMEALGVHCVTLNYKKAARQLVEVLHETS